MRIESWNWNSPNRAYSRPRSPHRHHFSSYRNRQQSNSIVWGSMTVICTVERSWARTRWRYDWDECCWERPCRSVDREQWCLDGRVTRSDTWQRRAGWSYWSSGITLHVLLFFFCLLKNGINFFGCRGKCRRKKVSYLLVCSEQSRSSHRSRSQWHDSKSPHWSCSDEHHDWKWRWTVWMYVDSSTRHHHHHHLLYYCCCCCCYCCSCCCYKNFDLLLYSMRNLWWYWVQKRMLHWQTVNYCDNN